MKIPRFNSTKGEDLVEHPFGSHVTFDDHTEVVMSLLGSIQQRESKIKEFEDKRGKVLFFAKPDGTTYPASQGQMDASDTPLYEDPQGRTIVIEVDPDNIALSKRRQIAELTKQVEELTAKLEKMS